MSLFHIKVSIDIRLPWSAIFNSAKIRSTDECSERREAVLLQHVKYIVSMYSKTCLKRPLSKHQKCVFKTKYRLMQVKSITECSLH